MACIKQQKALSANMVVIKADGHIIGMCQNFRSQTGYGTQGVYEIGSIMPIEHDHLRYEGTFSMERFVMNKDDIFEAGLIGLGEDILEKCTIDIEEYDKHNERTLKVYRGCTFSNYESTHSVNAITGANVQGYYLSADDGSGEG